MPAVTGFVDRESAIRRGDQGAVAFQQGDTVEGFGGAPDAAEGGPA